MASERPLAVVFAGSPEFALPTLEALSATAHELVGVYCQPDRPAGRGRKLSACAVASYARRHGLPLHQPASLRNAEAQAGLRGLQPDVVVVVAYGLLLPPPVLSLPRYGCINVHASLLPRWRGAAPIQRAILAGDDESGVSIMRLDAGLDTGPVYLKVPQRIEAGMTAGELHDRLAVLGATALAANLDAIVSGTMLAEPQSDRGATYAAKIEKHEAAIDWSEPAPRIERKVRAFNPWPGAETRVGERVFKIWQAQAADDDCNQTAGLVLDEGREGITVACGEGRLRLTRVQLAGRRALDASEFVNAHRLKGTRLG